VKGGIDTIDPAFYTVADGDGQTTAARKADVDVVATHDLPRSAAHPFYTRLIRDPDFCANRRSREPACRGGGRHPPRAG
jgi:hypothetical protein